MTSVQSVRVDWSCLLRLMAVMAPEKTPLMKPKSGTLWSAMVDRVSWDVNDE